MKIFINHTAMRLVDTLIQGQLGRLDCANLMLLPMWALWSQII
jgi:hypothetical protein